MISGGIPIHLHLLSIPSQLMVMCLVVPILVSGIAAGAFEEDCGYTFRMNQSVDGHGLFNAKDSVSSDQIYAESRVHGTGTYRSESKLSASHNYSFERWGDEYGQKKDQIIQLDRSSEIVSSACQFEEGKSFASGPLKSLISEGTTAKNRASGVVLSAQVRYANKLDERLSSETYLGPRTSIDEFWEQSHERSSRVKMDVDASLDGMANLEMTMPHMSTNEPQIYIDEAYSGSFNISKKMGVEAGSKRRVLFEGYLPCCSEYPENQTQYIWNGSGAHPGGRLAEWPYQGVEDENGLDGQMPDMTSLGITGDVRLAYKMLEGRPVDKVTEILNRANISYEVVEGRNESVPVGCIYFQGPIEESLNFSQSQVRLFVNRPLKVNISSPLSGDLVQNVVEVSGQISPGLNSSEHLWIAVSPTSAQANWWPQSDRPEISEDGLFKGTAYLNGAQNDIFEIGVLVVDDYLDSQIGRWTENCRSANSWPPITEGDPITGEKIPREVIESKKYSNSTVTLDLVQ